MLAACMLTLTVYNIAHQCATSSSRRLEKAAVKLQAHHVMSLDNRGATQSPPPTIYAVSEGSPLDSYKSRAVVIIMRARGGGLGHDANVSMNKLCPCSSYMYMYKFKSMMLLKVALCPSLFPPFQCYMLCVTLKRDGDEAT